MKSEKFDVCVIGAGPGGYVAAIRAGQLGMKVALIEKGELGGVCLNVGCIPTKTLIAGSEVLHTVKTADEFGVKFAGKVSVDWKKMLNRKNEVTGKLREGIAALLKGAGVKVFNGEASFLDRQTIKITKGKKADTIIAKHTIIATGSEPLVPGFVPKSDRVLTSTEILEIKNIPKSLIVLGGGVIGCEFACLFAALGTKVTVVEMMPSILPIIDKESARIVATEMKKAGIEIITGTPMEGIKATAKGVSGKAGNEKISGEYLLVSIGRKPISENMNLEAAGVKTDENNWIPVDEKCRTNITGIYAIGDITGTIQLAHWASAMGICAVENISGKRSEVSLDLVPGCIFTKPEIGTLGLSTEQCKEQGIDINVGKFPFAALGKAIAINDASGFCKIIADAETDQVLGVHIVGPHATDLISEAAPALNLEITAQELGKAIHAHPTLGEAMMEAAHAVHGESVHIMTRRKR